MFESFLFIISYFCGSIPFGLLLTQFSGIGDVRTIGSGNLGASNVLRTGNKALALATFIGDSLKGALPIWIMNKYDIEVLVIAASGAFLGHLFPIWLKFRGGKGVSTYAGLLFAFSIPAFFGFAAIWIFCAAMWRYSSLAALVATFISPLIVYFFIGSASVSLFSGMSLLTWLKHRKNIKRLLIGSERKIGDIQIL
ncbi:glycerol-3-phosphate 1-O-acyltransferase PlsY [Candidatus Endowatersipora endosymbiont of Watersipora subatra]|uniref:glycerol-3-phosphate 1-O-acyltransferase PlsY n=1 Tax=Candidatus Endowatersipora endosymbiont of Watersipora subatra TaxID=3077946 RepID=UPI00312C7E23